MKKMIVSVLFLTTVMSWSGFVWAGWGNKPTEETLAFMRAETR